MRVPSYQLGVFQPATWTVPQNPITGGMGDFVLGRFAVPQNPILDAGLGDFVAGKFAVPENPIDLTKGVDYFDDHQDCGCGCAGAGSCGSKGTAGLGTVTDDLMTWASGQWTNITAGDPTTIAIWGGAALVLAYLVFFHRSGYREEAKALRAKYQSQLAALKAQYPTVRGRASRALAAF